MFLFIYQYLTYLILLLFSSFLLNFRQSIKYLYRMQYFLLRYRLTASSRRLSRKQTEETISKRVLKVSDAFSYLSYIGKHVEEGGTAIITEKEMSNVYRYARGVIHCIFKVTTITISLFS